MRKAAAGLLVGGGILFGWHYTHRAAPVFQTAVVERGDMQSLVTANGTCSALVTVQVGSQISGIVTKLYADFNSTVHKGQLLAEVDPAPFIAKLTQAKAALDSAKASAEAAQATVDKAQVDIQVAKQQEQSQESLAGVARSAETFAKVEADRAGELARNEIGTVSDQIAAESAYNEAVATEAAAKATQEEADVAIRVGEEVYQAALTQMASAKAQVRQAEGAVEQAQLDLDHTRILSPTDGVVLSRDVDVGQTVAASVQAPLLFEIAQDLSRMLVDANIDESDVAKIRVGEQATFTVDALPNVTFHAVVGQVRKNPVNVQNVITYDVILPVANPGLQLFPGMTASVRFLTAMRPNVIEIPSAALRFQPYGVKAELGVQTVYTLDAANQPVQHRVETGITDGRLFELTSGDLAEGTAVIVSETRATR
jgi:HlyD family secretion protein